MKTKAFLSALGYKVSNEELKVIDQISLEAPKTKDVASILKAFGCEKKTLLITAGEAHVALSARNIPNLVVADAQLVNVYELVSSVNVLATKEAIKYIEEAYKL